MICVRYKVSERHHQYRPSTPQWPPLDLRPQTPKSSPKHPFIHSNPYLARPELPIFVRLEPQIGRHEGGEGDVGGVANRALWQVGLTCGDWFRVCGEGEGEGGVWSCVCVNEWDWVGGMCVREGEKHSVVDRANTPR